MSDRLERSTPRASAREVTPKTERPDLFAFLEDKWKEREEGPRTLRLCLAFGPGGGTWRPDTIHEKEFKKNADPPSRPEIAELTNVFYAAAKRHCDEHGVKQRYVVLAYNPAKGAHPYGVHLLKLIPTPGLETTGGHEGDGESSILSDGEHRDLLLKESLSHMQESNQHVRFMADANHKYTGQVLAMQQEIIREQQETIKFYKSQDVERIKMLEELFSKRHERELEKEKHQMIMGLATGGIGLLQQMIPSFNKAIEARSTIPTAAIAGPVSESKESKAIQKFVRECDNEQKLSLFGYNDGEKHVPGILTTTQTEILGAVGDLRAHHSVLAALMTGGQHEITIAQVMQMLQSVPQDRLIELKSAILDGNHAPQQSAPAPAQQEAQP